MNKYFPTSHFQNRLWFIDEFERNSLYPASPTYHNIPLLLKLNGYVDQSHLQLAINEVVKLHSVLRTKITEVEKEPFQEIQDTNQVDLNLVTVTSMRHAINCAVEDNRKPFDIRNNVPVRASLYSIHNSEHLLCLSVHHILCDRASLAIITRQLFSTYDALRAGEHATGTTPLQYTDFVKWCQELPGDFMDDLLLSLKKQMKGELAPLDVPSTSKRDPIHIYKHALLDVDIDIELSDSVTKLSKENGLSPKAIWLAGFIVLLHKYSGQEEIVLGMPASLRDQTEMRDIVGPLFNPVTLRTWVDGKSDFIAFCKDVAHQLEELEERKYFPFDQLVVELKPAKDMSRTALFDFMFDVQSVSVFKSTELEITVLDQNEGYGKYDFNVLVLEGSTRCTIQWCYNSLYYSSELMQHYARHYQHILLQLTNNPKERISSFSLLTASEKLHYLIDFNNTDCYYPSGSVVSLWKESARKNADSLSVIASTSLSYATLDRLSDQLGSELIARGVTPGTMVPLLSDASSDLIVGMLGIMKAGAAYVPLDPNHPIDRIQYVLEDIGANALVCDAASQMIADKLSCKTTIIIDTHIKDLKSVTFPEVSPDSIAYIIYTSGTTGTPKGCLVSHRNIVRLILPDESRFSFSGSDRWTMFHSPCFDFSVWEIFGALLTGGTLMIPSRDIAKDPTKFHQYLLDNKVTVLNQTPRAFYNLAQVEVQAARHKLLDLRYVIFGGERLDFEKLKSWNNIYAIEKIALFNLYGITETTVHTSFYRITDNDIKNPDGLSRIGVPLPETKIYLLDKDLQPVPALVAGEIYVAGTGVAAGYWNRPEITRERFIDCPFGDHKMYRSGDLALRDLNGCIQYIGRNDHQVKVRGYRIELREIECVLRQFPGVHEAVAIVKEEQGATELIAFVKADDFDLGKYGSYLKTKLPDYMVPSKYYEIDQFKLTANGKIDINVLKTWTGTLSLSKTLKRPTSAKEHAIADTAAKLLKLKSVSMEENFFYIGGDSIKALQLISRLYQTGYKIDLRDIFRNPTLAGIAGQLKPAESVIARGELNHKFVLTPVQQQFLEAQTVTPNHFCQSVLLKLSPGVTAQNITPALAALARDHEMLSTVFERSASGWTQSNIQWIAQITNINGADVDWREVVKQQCATMDLDSGPLFKACYHEGSTSYLLLVAHHLIVDIVSWQILLQDLDHYLSGADNIAVRSVPYSEWSTSIQRFAFSSECLQMINYWKELELSPLPSGTDVYEMNHAHVHRFSISSESTDLFVQWTKNNELSIGDTLPSLTGVAFCEAFNVGRVSGMIEGHGRDQRGINVDISRTIGWFTITYPSAFDRKEVQDWTSYVKKSSDVLSAARDNGIGFEIGQALSAFAGVDTRTLFRFNYLGNSSGYDAYQSFDIEEANHSTNVSEKLLMNYPFEVGMSIYKGKINCSITCDQRKHVETVKTIEKYITYFIESVGGVATTNRPKSKDINWYSLSPMQKGILFHSIYNKGSNNYFTQFYYQLDGALDVDSFRKAFGALITRHEIGRTIFRFGDGREPGQGTDESIVPDFELLDVTRLTASQQDAAFEEFRRNDLERNFDLTADSLIRLKVVIFGEKTFKIMWSYHHIVVDGWAMSLVMDDFNKCYENLCANRRAVVPFRPPYRRFIEWIDTNVDALANISYWKKYLLEYKRLASLPASNRTSQLVSEANIAHEYLRIDKKTSAEIKAFVAREEVTLYQYIQGIWAILLSIYNKTDDVVFGTVVSGRPPELPGIESTIGLFINAIPVRVKLNDDETFCQLLRGVRESFIESGPYSYFSMAEIQGLSLLKNNLIDHLLIFENFPLAENTGAFGKSSFDQLIVTNVKAHDINNYDLNVAVFPGEEITVRITYNNSKFDVEMISEALEILSSIVEQSLHDECLVNGLRKIPNAIRTRLIEIGRSKAAPVSFLVHKKFDELSRSNPSSPAVVADGREVGYGELNMMSKAIAAHLVQEGLSPTQVVAILMTPSVEIFASMLGVLEAGGVLLLIDPSTPAERQKSIIADSGAWGVCTTSDMLQYLGGENENVIAVDLLDTATDAVIDVVVSEADPMYVIYTSGTTGVPKGSKISHAGLSNMIADQIGRLKVSSTDVVLQFASMSFDGFMYETWLALTSGASILCLAKEVKLNPNLMIDKMKSSRVSIVALPPSYLHKALTNITGEDKPFEFLRVLISAGEAINRDAAIALSKYIDVFNLYGPSECAVTVTAHKIDAQDSIRRIIPIGVPITGYSVFILDESMQPVPLGVTGQIFVDSPGVSSGYINKIEATNAKFITATLDKRRRLYATGDAARWLPDGSIEYGGRIDNQLKLNGFRIEPEEVEAAIATRNGIVQVAVIPDRATDTLVAFVVSEDHLSTAEMRNYLIRLLPEYMIPARFVFPASLPLTSHGKIARNELVIPSQAEAKTIFDDVDDSTLNEVRKVWSTVLQHSNFTTGSNFFDVGGNSLLMIQMHGLLKTKWSFLEITDLFAHTTIGDISKYIRDLEQPSDLPELKGTLMAEEFCSDESNDQSQFEITGIMNSETLKLIPDQIDHWNTVLALFAYSLYERSLSETILFYGWNIEINSISTIQLDMNNISDSKELCTVIASQMKTSGPLKYRATISSNQLLSAVVVPGNYQQSTSAFDLIFKIGDDIGSENITMICNGSKVSRDGAHDLLKGFIENASNLSGSLMTSSLKEINS